MRLGGFRSWLLAGVVAVAAACDDGTPQIIVPDAPDDVIETFCSPLTQLGCEPDQKCAWIEDQEEPRIGHIGCVPEGDVAVGEACLVGAPGPAGYSNCVRGSECVAGVCRAICDHQGGMPACDANHACSRYEGLFESGSTPVAGVCDPKCDPLTQSLLAGGAEACGSTMPAMPDRGCFTSDLVDFTCAPVGAAQLPLTDRMPALTSPSGGAYINGCSPGFLPFFRQMTGSSTVVCAGTCAPLPTDDTLPQNATGDANVPAKLPAEATSLPGNARCIANRKGSELGQNCRFWWFFNIENGQIVPSTYNDTLGICFAPQHYTYDHDMNSQTPRLDVPSCTQLPAKGAPPDPDHGTADQWGCYNSVDSLEGSAPHAAPRIHPAMKDFRVGYGAGQGVRHRFR